MFEKGEPVFEEGSSFGRAPIWTLLGQLTVSREPVG
jgi:hypothetical protein